MSSSAPSGVTDFSTRFDARQQVGAFDEQLPAAPCPLLIIGATGTLGRAFAHICETRNLAFRLLGRGEMDIADLAAVEAAFDRHQPWAVVNAAGYVRVDEAERNPERCHRENVLGPAVLAGACARHGVQFVTFSSDLVFDGSQRSPYVESDRVRPLSCYGRTKAEAETQVLNLLPESLVVRTSAFFGPWDEHNFASIMLRTLAAGDGFAAPNDATVSPTFVPDLVNACLDLLIDGERGLWHLAHFEALTWLAFAERIANRAGVDASRLIGCRERELCLAAPRPAYSVLGSERGHVMPALDDAIGRYLAARAAARKTPNTEELVTQTAVASPCGKNVEYGCRSRI